jgi:hypothetical protein
MEMKMANHKWQSSGGCSENPGVFDSGNGGMVYVSVCSHCGLTRERGHDYTGQRPGNTWGPVYTTPAGVRVGSMACSASEIQRVDAIERNRLAKEAEARIVESRAREAEARARQACDQREANYRTAISAILAARPELLNCRADIYGNDDWSFLSFVPRDGRKRADFDRGKVS